MAPARAPREIIMKLNVGGMDRTARFIVGVVLVLVAALAPLDMVWRIVAGVVAAVALVTGAVQFCPANALLGIDTYKGGAEKK
jgi:disulfide bond formation protein DsbB